LLSSAAESIMNRHRPRHLPLVAVALVFFAGVAHAQREQSVVTPAAVSLTSSAHTATRLLVARSAKLNRVGWLEATTTFTPGAGLTYTIIREGGDKRIRNRVLRQVLENEVEMSAPARALQLAISEANYHIVTDPAGGTLRLAPRRKEPTLIEGTAQVDARGRLQKVEGRLAKSPSFWVRSVKVRRTYQTVSGHALPVLVESVADVKLAGACEFSMWIDYTAVDGIRIDRVATRPPMPGSEPSQLLIALR
jgi:hypothetical protein